MYCIISCICTLGVLLQLLVHTTQVGSVSTYTTEIATYCTHGVLVVGEAHGDVVTELDIE